MKIIADLQVHSRFARATSKDITLESLEKYARIKGLGLLGTADFQHPQWNKEIKKALSEDGNGILWSKTGFPFIWQTEISLMYSQGGKGRAVHVLVYAPDTITADRIISYLSSKGRLDYDGRPIFGMSCHDAVKDLKAINDAVEIIPAHCLLPGEKVICNPEVKPISKIEVGDKVLTHKGTYQKVTNTLVRHYIGRIYKVKPWYFNEGISVTEEHPFFAMKTVKDCTYVGGLCKPNNLKKNGYTCKKKHYLAYKAEWINAEELEVNDALVYPRCSKVEDIDAIFLSKMLSSKEFTVKGNHITVAKFGRQDKLITNRVEITPDLCRLIGYYLAEGWLIKKTNCLGFSFSAQEQDYIDDVINLVKRYFGLDIALKRERNGYDLIFRSKVLVHLFADLLYEKDKLPRANSKKMPQWMLNLPLEKQVELFKGWWAGDSGVTVSETLAEQMKIICLRLGIIPSLYKSTKEDQARYNRKINGRKITAKNDTFYLHNLSFFEDKFSLLGNPLFKKFRTKLKRRHGWIDSDNIYLPIKSIGISNYSGPVHNLEVENDNSYVTPSAAVHNCMTPFFGVYGSKSGFDSLKECLGDQADKVYAVESGMSADPGMLWRFKEQFNVVSFSDAHSMWPWRIGREATIFDIPKLTYRNVMHAIRTGDGLAGTIETPPAYGRYHWDGHRDCSFESSPEETKKLNGICPECGKKLIIGVDYRVEELAKEPDGYKPKGAKPYYTLVPLHELIAFHLGTSLLSSKKVWAIYDALIRRFGTEFNVLLTADEGELKAALHDDEALVKLIMLNREAKLPIQPGYDGVYGKINLSAEKAADAQRQPDGGQKGLSGFLG